jgi:hypothetical protein
MSTVTEIVRSAMRDIAPMHDMPDGVNVTTNCLYPSGGFVRVSVRGGGESFVVSDNGGALQEVESAGLTWSKLQPKVRALLPEVCAMQEGNIRSAVVSKADLPFVIVAVANASKDVAEHLFRTLTIKRDYDFKQLVAAFLQQTFPDRVRHNQIFIGASNKAHNFDNVVIFPSGAKLIVDPVLNDPNSCNARMVANFDVKQAHIEGLEQRIIFDDQERWSPTDINLLTMAATMVPFSKSGQVFRKLAA